MKAHELKAILAHTPDDSDIEIAAFGRMITLDPRSAQWGARELTLSASGRDGAEPEDDNASLLIFPLDLRSDALLPPAALDAAMAKMTSVLDNENADAFDAEISRGVRAAILTMVRQYNSEADGETNVEQTVDGQPLTACDPIGNTGMGVPNGVYMARATVAAIDPDTKVMHIRPATPREGIVAALRPVFERLGWQFLDAADEVAENFDNSARSQVDLGELADAVLGKAR